MIIGHNLLDQSTTDDTVAYVQNGIRLNLHCWHTDNRFSKFVFKMGKYNESELDKYRNDTTVQAYVRMKIPCTDEIDDFLLGHANGSRIEVYDAGRDGSDRSKYYENSWVGGR